MAQQGQPRVSQIQMNKKDPMKGLTISIQGFAGIINTQPPDLIPDNAVQDIYNFLPIGNGTIRKLQSPSLVVNLPTNPLIMVNDILYGYLTMFVILADGSAGTVSNGTYTQVAPANTFSTVASNIQITNWQNQFYIITDSTKGIFAFAVGYTPSATTWAASTSYVVGNIVKNGSYYYWCITAGTSGSSAPTFPTTPGQTVTDNTVVWQCFTVSNGLMTVHPDILGNTIIVYEGRVFIGGGRNIQYSAPLSFLDFTTTNGGGTFQIESPDLKQEIVKLISYMNNIYVVGDHAVIAITGTTINNDPSLWYMQEIFNTTGSIYPNSIINFNNTIYLVNEYGIYQVISSQSQKIDYSIDITKLNWTNAGCDIAQINNLNFYLLPVNKYSILFSQNYNMLLAYCIDLQQFYQIDLGFNILGVYATRSITDHSIYILAQNSIYKLGGGTSNLKGLIRTKNFDFGYPFLYKTVRSTSFNLIPYSGSPNISLTANLQSLTGTSPSVTGTNMNASKYVNNVAIAVSTTTAPLYILPQNSVNIPLLINTNTTVPASYLPIFYLNVSGSAFSFDIVDNSNASFDIIQTYIKAFLGRSIV